MAGLSLVSILLMQSDKLLVSKFMNLSMISYYTIAGTLASIPLMMAQPITSAISPRLAALVAQSKQNKLTELYHQSSALVATIAIPCGLTIAAFSLELIFAWTHSEKIAKYSAVSASFLLVGNTISTIMLIPHFLALAYGYVRLNMFVGVVSLFVLIPLLLIGLPIYGIVGGSIAWMLTNLVSMVIYVYLIHHKYLPGHLKKWYINSLFRPLIVTVPIVSAARLIFPNGQSIFLNLLMIGFVMLSCILSLVLIQINFRNAFFTKITHCYGKINEKIKS